MSFDTIIDGGYFSYIFGTRPEADFGGWSKSKYQYRNALIALEGGRLWRKDIFPDYKERRSQRRKDDLTVKLKRDRVNMFRTFLSEDPLLQTTFLPGFEADDVLSIVFLDYKDLPVMAVDKDLFQVPGLAKKMVNFTGQPSLRPLKQPQYTFKTENPPERVFHQALFGDRSDGIPRLLSSVGAQATLQYRELFKGLNWNPSETWASVELFNRGEQAFGDQFWMNLLLLLMPAPVLSSEYQLYQTNHEALYRAIVYLDYWNTNHYQVPKKLIFETLQSGPDFWATKGG